MKLEVMMMDGLKSGVGGGRRVELLGVKEVEG